MLAVLLMPTSSPTRRCSNHQAVSGSTTASRCSLPVAMPMLRWFDLSCACLLGMRLHPTKTGVHLHDVQSAEWSTWSYLGLRWRGGDAHLDPTSLFAILRRSRDIVDTIDIRANASHRFADCSTRG